MLFTLGSIYSTNATVGPSKCLDKKKNQLKLNLRGLRIPADRR